MQACLVFRSGRIIYLYEKYKHITNRDLWVNVLSKQLSKHYEKRHNKTFASILEASMNCGSTSTRKNQFYKSVGFRKDWPGITLFIDGYISEDYLPFRSNFNVAVLSEAKAIKPISYQKVMQLADYFDLIITYDKTLLKAYPKKSAFFPADTPTRPLRFNCQLLNNGIPIDQLIRKRNLPQVKKITNNHNGSSSNAQCLYHTGPVQYIRVY